MKLRGVIVSKKFDEGKLKKGQKGYRLARQREYTNLIENELNDETVHACTFKTFTPDEYKAKTKK